MENIVTERSNQRPRPEIYTDDLKSFVNYRNLEDDKIQLAIQEDEKWLWAQGKPLVKH